MSYLYTTASLSNPAEKCGKCDINKRRLNVKKFCKRDYGELYTWIIFKWNDFRFFEIFRTLGYGEKKNKEFGFLLFSFLWNKLIKQTTILSSVCFVNNNRCDDVISSQPSWRRFKTGSSWENGSSSTLSSKRGSKTAWTRCRWEAKTRPFGWRWIPWPASAPASGSAGENCIAGLFLFFYFYLFIFFFKSVPGQTHLRMYSHFLLVPE